ncbi:MAG: hypothetical protein RI904_1851 [Pseudomonadota bacterium]
MGISEYFRTESIVRLSAASVSSEYKPTQPFVMRPIGSTPVASIMSNGKRHMSEMNGMPVGR